MNTELYLQQVIDAISESVSFDSSLKKAVKGMPFGKGAAECLEHFLTLADKMGFETHNYDNYVGEVVFGEGEEFAILAHLDVVPAGQGWTTSPFKAVLIDDKLYGRGTMDDKGPAIASLFALYALKEEGFLPKRKIKLIVGCNEECGWACIDHYKEVSHMPDDGFSPDANFPVIYAEKGIAHVEFHFPVSAPFTTFSGGERANMVCDYAVSTPVTLKKERAYGLGLEVARAKLVSRGKSAHGSTPEDGVNALLPMLRYYQDDPTVAKIIDCLFNDCEELKKLHDETGFLTMSPDVARYDDETKTLHVLTDFRYPASLKLETLEKKWKKFGVEYTVTNHQLPLYHEKNSTLVTTLCDVYSKFSGKKEKPIAIGGGTYARALKNGVAFGPEIEGEEVTIHQANEYITIDRIRLMLDVYSEAIKELTK